jgi:hypothetical protein
VKTNHRAVIGSLLATLQRHGFELQLVDDGGKRHRLTGTPRTRRQEAKGHIVGVESSDLWVIEPVSGKSLWLLIVLGNAPEETVADFTISEKLEKAIDDFSNKWEKKSA